MAESVRLEEIYLFRQLPAKGLAELRAALQPRTLRRDQVLFRQGDPGQEMFIVQKGSVGIFIPSKDHPGQERPIRIFGPGEAMGEMALIDRQPRSTSARAMEDSEVLVLSGDDFRRLMTRYPDMALAVMSGLNERIRYTTNFLGEVREWVQRVAAGDYQRGFVPCTEYCDRSLTTLAAEFAQMAAQVQQREEALRREIQELRIVIDEAKKQRQVGDIVESDYFQKLRQQARRLRQQRGE